MSENKRSYWIWSRRWHMEYTPKPEEWKRELSQGASSTTRLSICRWRRNSLCAGWFHYEGCYNVTTGLSIYEFPCHQRAGRADHGDWPTHVQLDPAWGNLSTLVSATCHGWKEITPDKDVWSWPAKHLKKWCWRHRTNCYFLIYILWWSRYSINETLML